MKKFNLLTTLTLFFTFFLVLTGCGDDDDGDERELEIPPTYISSAYDDNVVAEATVIDELGAMTSDANDAEANAQNTTVSAITYPSNLSNVTLSSYRALVTDWLVELVASANDDDGFQNPGPNGTPAAGEEGGLLGTRLLDENGLELEQMVQKGSFGASLYNHALSVINAGNLTGDDIDKLVEIHGTEPTFNPDLTTQAAVYSRRRSNQTTQIGSFYEIRNSLITAKAAAEAIEDGGDFQDELNDALDQYLLAWEESNFATVIYYCNATRDQLLEAQGNDEALGDALHAYAEGVGFAHGFKGVSNKLITDAEIDSILSKLLAEDGEIPESHRFLNEPSLLDDLQEIIDDIQAIYDFTDAEVASFFENDPM
ncbi:MAG: hypothetical protein AAGI25_15685 [Bacteroidota bacterium]